MTDEAVSALRTAPLPKCDLCGNYGDVLYSGLSDRLFGVPGTWSLKQCRNAQCRLIWLDPMPLELDLWLAYRDYYTHHGRVRRRSWWQSINRRVSDGYMQIRYGYPSAHAIDRLMGLFVYLIPGRRSELDFKAMHLPFRAGARLLEIGCGSGEVLAEVASRGWQVEGVDFDPEAVECARGRGLHVHLGSLADQHFPDQHFDAIVMNHLIEHVYDPVALLRECRRILRDQGTVIIVTPNSASLGHRWYGRDWKALEPPRHLHLFCRPAMRRLLQQAGFRAHVTSSIRDANGIYLATGDLRRFGHHAMGSAQSEGRRWLGRLFQLWEWVLNCFSGDAGEELVVVAQKDAGHP